MYNLCMIMVGKTNIGSFNNVLTNQTELEYLTIATYPLWTILWMGIPNKLSNHPIIVFHNNGSWLYDSNDFLEICQSNNGVNGPIDDLILLTFAKGVEP